VLQQIQSIHLPASWRPKANQFVRASSIPTLGTGKMDLRAIKPLAASLATEVETEAQV
jgi:hypothetical protein